MKHIETRGTGNLGTRRRLGASVALMRDGFFSFLPRFFLPLFGAFFAVHMMFRGICLFGFGLPVCVSFFRNFSLCRSFFFLFPIFFSFSVSGLLACVYCTCRMQYDGNGIVQTVY